MNIRDMGNKEGGRTWWGALLLGLGGTLIVGQAAFGALIPMPYALVIPGMTVVIGVVTTTLGLGRKWGEMIKMLGHKAPQ